MHLYSTENEGKDWCVNLQAKLDICTASNKEVNSHVIYTQIQVTWLIIYIHVYILIWIILLSRLSLVPRHSWYTPSTNIQWNIVKPAARICFASYTYICIPVLPQNKIRTQHGFSSFSWVNPLALTQLPLCAGPSDTISICCNYRDPSPPTLSASLTHTHTEDTAHWCNSCCLGGHGRLWVGSINVMVHTHKRSHTLAQPHHRWGPPYLPSPTEGHPAANEDTQTPSTVSTTWA